LYALCWNVVAFDDVALPFGSRSGTFTGDCWYLFDLRCSTFCCCYGTLCSLFVYDLFVTLFVVLTLFVAIAVPFVVVIRFRCCCCYVVVLLLITLPTFERWLLCLRWCSRYGVVVIAVCWVFTVVVDVGVRY
jgi:hypothetical protein